MSAAVKKQVSDEPTERLEAEACTLAAQIAATTSRFVKVITELDRREAWAEWGCRSMAHWLAWKCGLGLVAARQHVRVARALTTLPQISEEFAGGRLSYSKVRALTRVATPESEHQVVEFARNTTASQLEVAIRGYERTRADATDARAQVGRRRFRIFHEDDATVTFSIRLPRDAAEHFLAAVEAAREEVPADPEDDSAESSRADALQVVADHYLAGRSERVPTEIVVHVDDEELHPDRISPTVERLACDTAIRISRSSASSTSSTSLGADLTPAGITRRSQTIPIALRRTVEHRDQHCCRFPGCTNRRHLHVHHIVHRARNGPTNETNCVLLCPFHHRAVHEGGWRVHGDARQRGQLIFLNPRGRRIHEYVAPPTAGRPILTLPDISEFTMACGLGEPMHRALAIDALTRILPTNDG